MPSKQKVPKAPREPKKKPEVNPLPQCGKCYSTGTVLTGKCSTTKLQKKLVQYKCTYCGYTKHISSTAAVAAYELMFNRVVPTTPRLPKLEPK